MSQGKWKDKDPRKWPYLSINKHGVIGQHKTAATACRAAVKFEFGRVERWDRMPEDFTAEMREAKRLWIKQKKENQRSLDAALSRQNQQNFNSPEMRKRRAAAIRKIETREQFDPSDLADDVFSLFKRITSRERRSVDAQKIYGTYQGKSVFG